MLYAALIAWDRKYMIRSKAKIREIVMRERQKDEGRVLFHT